MTSVDHSRSAPSWRRVEIALIDTARRLRNAFDHRLAELDLNLNQASLLAFVNDFGGTNQTELAELVGVGRASCGAMIDQLEARGLVTRNPDPHDRRVWLVGITDEFGELGLVGAAEVVNEGEQRRLVEVEVELGEAVVEGIPQAPGRVDQRNLDATPGRRSAGVIDGRHAVRMVPYSPTHDNSGADSWSSPREAWLDPSDGVRAV